MYYEIGQLNYFDVAQLCNKTTKEIKTMHHTVKHISTLYFHSYEWHLIFSQAVAFEVASFTL